MAAMSDTAFDQDPRSFLRACLDRGLGAALAGPAVLRNLPPKPRGRVVVVGAGKASAAMAAAVDTAWADVDLTGVVVTRYDHAVPAGRIRVLEAGHPVPDENSLLAAHALLDAVSDLNADDLVLALISGGGSACLALPVPELSLSEKQALTRALLHSGAPISAVNTVRRHVSAIKGGKLAAAALPAQTVTLLISDVPGDDPAAIASGPTLADGSTPQDALAIIDRYGISIPPALRTRLSAGEPAVSCNGNGPHALVATPRQSLEAAAAYAQTCGVTPIMMGDALEGESAELGKAMARHALEHANRATNPVVLLSGGETTVTIGPEGAGRGGRNCEFLLALASELNGAPRIYALAADTDGIDGTEDTAGAVIDPDSITRARNAGFAPDLVLAQHDSYSLFAATGDLLVTGPTHTNVNDFRAVLILPRADVVPSIG